MLFVRATYIMVLFFTHIPFVVNHTINATPPERFQHSFLVGVDKSDLNFALGYKCSNYKTELCIIADGPQNLLILS